MQSASPNGRLQFASVAWDRTRESLGGGRAWSAVLVLLLTFAVARSTTTVHWVDGIEVITLIALVGALVMGLLALLPIAEPLFLLTFAVARSTTTVHWVDGIEVITLIALVGALVMGLLALLPIAEPLSLLA